jgi:hypothetical protein
MEPQIGQRWMYNQGIIEITDIAEDKSWYTGKVVDPGPKWILEIGYIWQRLPGWRNGKVLDMWSYLPGQDAPKNM